MKTMLAVRDVWLIVSEVLVYLAIYHVMIGLVVDGFNPWLLAPLGLYLLFIRYFVPHLAKLGKMRRMPALSWRGRISDANTNITTVKLFSHSNRESAHARSAMADFLRTVRRQMRMVTGLEILNQMLAVLMIGSMGGVTLVMWTQGRSGVGAVAAAIAMALRLSGISNSMSGRCPRCWSRSVWCRTVCPRWPLVRVSLTSLVPGRL
jgi:ATP-binding cassette, subfamily B, multidrug efflux pump